jgi:alpha-L-fucosidase 2
MDWRLTRRKFVSHLGSLVAALPFPGLSHKWLAEDPKLAGENADFLLWFAEPAKQWSDALPVGNGRLGAMLFGGFSTERAALNEDTLWSGGPRDWNNPGAKQHLPVIRNLVLAQRSYHEADVECREMQGPYNQSYEPLADLAIKFAHGLQVSRYRRSLDLDSGIAKVTYQANLVQYTREVFCSSPAQLLVMRLTCSKVNGLQL